MNNYNNHKSVLKKIIVSYLNKILICFIILIVSLIVVKNKPDYKSFISNNIYKKNLSFAYINNLYNKYLGSIIPSIKKNKTETVFNEKLEYTSINEYLNGYKLSVSNMYLVPIIKSGIVVYSGKINDYGNTIIISGIDGVNILYGNLVNINVNLYDYVNEGDFIGECSKELYLEFEKNKEYLKFDEYFKN